MTIEQQIINAALAAVKELYGQEVAEKMVQLQKTKKEFEGNLTLVVFPFLKISRKKPDETAREIGEYIKQNCEAIADFNAVGGFLNLVIDKKAWLALLSEMNQNEKFGEKPVTEASPLVMIEYSSPNTNNAVNYGTETSQSWVLYRYAKDAYGYVDASLNTDDYSTFDIDWAVDELGNHVDLEEINFVKVVNGTFQYCGWLGETSTEVTGFQDLHLVEGYDENPIIITPRTSTGLSVVKTDSKFTAKDDSYYDLMGRRVATPQKGIYIRNGKKIIFK